MTRKLRLLPFATFHVCAVALVMAGNGCSGSIGGTGVNGGGGGESGEGGRRTGGNGEGGSGGDAVGAQCPDPQNVAPGPTPLRRLTKAEYNNTVADLLGEASQPANAFPPESRVHGFDNDVTTQTVTYTLADYTFKAAEQLASKATTRLDTLLGCNPTQAGEASCAESFIRSFGLRTYRRPLTDDERASLMALYEKGKQNGDFKNGIKLVMTRMLASPHFLYRPELDGLDAAGGKAYVRLSPYEMASRLSYLIWGTMPDQDLFNAAANDELRTPEQIKSHVGRMLQDHKAKAAMARFYSGWLHVAHARAVGEGRKAVSWLRSSRSFHGGRGLANDGRRHLGG